MLDSFLGNTCSIGAIEFTFLSYQGSVPANQLTLDPFSAGAGFTLQGIMLVAEPGSTAEAQGSLIYSFRTLGNYRLTETWTDSGAGLLAGYYYDVFGVTGNKIALKDGRTYEGGSDFLGGWQFAAFKEAHFLGMMPYIHSGSGTTYFSGRLGAFGEPTARMEFAPYFSFDVRPIPEPGTFLMVATGLLSLAGSMLGGKKRVR